MKKTLTALSFFILAAGFCGGALSAFTVAEVIDGTNIVLDRGDNLRLMGIESNGSATAADYVKRVAGAHEVDVELDPDLEGQSYEDTDGNVLAYIYVHAPADPSETDVVRDEKGRIFLNASLLATGQAQTRLKPSFQRFAEFVHHEAEAKRGKKGQWSNWE